MIEIKVSEFLYPEDPNMNAIQRSQMEMFLDGFKNLCEKTKMNNIHIWTFFNGVEIPTELNFNDGSSIGISRLFSELGFELNKNK